jgi:hypothetical protein
MSPEMGQHALQSSRMPAHHVDSRRTTRWATRPPDRKVVREADLMRWGWPSQVRATDVLRTDIRRLRERISPLGLEIVAIRRVGYRL